MGGFGSGRKFGADCTEDCRLIDVRHWQRQGLLVAGLSFNCNWTRRGNPNGSVQVKTETELVRLFYSCRKSGGEWEQLDYPVKLQTTVCHYGGVRYWFTCPADGCGRRVAILYLGDKYFACRHCYKLAYRSQRETIDDRLIRKADKIRDKLIWEPGILNGNGWKPKGMHWKTFWKLQSTHNLYAKAGLDGHMAKLSRKKS